MPDNASHADIFLDWEGLVLAAEEHKELLPSVGPYLPRMKEISTEVKVLKARQESYEASRRLTTQELSALFAQGREQAIRLRGAIKADLGPRSELLGHFGIAPQRRRTRRSVNEKAKSSKAQTKETSQEAEPVKPTT